MTKSRSRRPHGRPTITQTEQIPNRLLDAASWLFVRRGFSGTTMEAIAKRARASTKTLYSRYSSKEDVLRAVVRRMFDAALQGGDQDDLSFGQSPREDLKRLGASLAALSAAPETAGVNRLIFGEAFKVPEIGDLFLDVHESASAIVKRHLEHWMREGDLKPIENVNAVAQVFVEMVASVPRMWAMLGKRLTDEETERIVAASIDVLIDGCGQP
ncbi:MAG: TetR/AcrR family transcriptional regulator [Armatimonadetes bacterium]|nr:TetR/AcrR family transcriptional regulator [Armatimonadota bacterium]